ncbi:MAG TPA: hypothetical protein VM370_05020 [Candidatus Thermoplasmatota archaeon]|nr:hypothetical protein [Candidatus Thermoplasmatota archaeon]
MIRTALVLLLLATPLLAVAPSASADTCAAADPTVEEAVCPAVLAFYRAFYTAGCVATSYKRAGECLP